MALDAEPAPDTLESYAIVDGMAVHHNQFHPSQRPMLDGPRYRNHVTTCKPPERKRHGQGQMS